MPGKFYLASMTTPNSQIIHMLIILLTLASIILLRFIVGRVRMLFGRDIIHQPREFFFCGFLIVAVGILVFYGLPFLFVAFPPFLFVFLVVVGLMIFLFPISASISGNALVDVMGLAIVSTILAIVVAKGFVVIVPYGLNTGLLLLCLVASFVVAMILKVIHWMME